MKRLSLALLLVTALPALAGEGAEVPTGINDTPSVTASSGPLAPDPRGVAPTALASAQDPLLHEPAAAQDSLLDEPSPPGGAAVVEGMGDLLGSFARTTLMLLVVLALVYLTLHKGVGKLVQRNQSGKRMKVVERVGLDPRRALYIIDVDGREMLIGTGEGGMVHLAELGVPTSAPSPRPFSQALTDVSARDAETAEKEGAA